MERLGSSNVVRNAGSNTNSMILTLAREGASRGKISDLTGRSLYGVDSVLHRERIKDPNYLSRYRFNQELLRKVLGSADTEISSQDLLDCVNWSMYRRYRRYFVTVSECSRQAGLRVEPGESIRPFTEFLLDNGVAARELVLPNQGGGRFRRAYHFLWKHDEKKAVSVLRSLPRN